MEEKYRKLAVDLGIKREDEDKCCSMPSRKLNGLERENEEKIKLLTDVIIEQRKRINMLESTNTELVNAINDTKLDVSELRKEIDTLEKIIDKCNATYYSNSKVQTVYDGTVKAVEECVKQRSKKDE